MDTMTAYVPMYYVSYGRSFFMTEYRVEIDVNADASDLAVVALAEPAARALSAQVDVLIEGDPESATDEAIKAAIRTATGGQMYV